MRVSGLPALGASVVLVVGLGVVAAPAASAVTCPTVDTGPDTMLPNGPDPGSVTPAPTPGVNWSGCDLSQAFLSGAKMRGANLAGANLTGVNLSGADLRGANLAGATLRGTDFSVANLTNANLRGVELTPGRLSAAYVTGANLTGATVPCGPRGKIVVGRNMTGTPAVLPPGWSRTGAPQHGKLTALRLPCPSSG